MESDSSRALIFRLNENGEGPEFLRQVFLEKGWLEFDEDENEEWEWNLWWRTSRFRNCDYEHLLPWQRLNHYPKSTAITKKDSLARNMKRMKGVYGAVIYNFSPNAFNLPNDYTKFVSEYTKFKEKEKRTSYWICKPADLSRGRGIFLFRDLSELQYDCNAVVQEYITNPMLISGYKFDLRIYVLVPSFQPLYAYIYQEGLVRFSTEKYDLSALDNMYSHLTNTSINKHSPAYSMDKERIGPGCKWTITQLRHYFLQTLNIDDNELWGRISNIIVLTLIIQASQVPKAQNCFELYGFDILIDDHLKPWLLEVNFSPALGSDCQADIIVKKPLLHDMAEMLQFTEHDIERRAAPNTVYPGQYSWHNTVPSALSLPLRSRNRRSTSRKTSHSSLSCSRRSKLPDLPYVRSTGTLSTASQLSWPSACVEEEEEECMSVVPIIPGCGLPSVQQPIQASPSSSSGRSSPADFPEAYPCVPAIPSDGRLTMQTSKRAGTCVRKHNSLVSLNRARTMQKRESKVSVCSDSAISSFSGSSDASDANKEDQTAVQASKVDQTTPGKKLVPRTGNKSALSKLPDFDHGVITKTTDIIETSSLKEINNNEVKVPLVTRGKTSGVQRGGRRRLETNTKLSSKTISSRSSLSHRKLSYAKPWRGHTADTSRQPASGGDVRQLAERVGDFVRIYPFNEVTRKSSQAPDPHLVIRECHKILKARLAGRSCASGASMVWGPLSATDLVPR